MEGSQVHYQHHLKFVASIVHLLRLPFSGLVAQLFFAVLSDSLNLTIEVKTVAMHHEMDDTQGQSCKSQPLK